MSDDTKQPVGPAEEPAAEEKKEKEDKGGTVAPEITPTELDNIFQPEQPAEEQAPAPAERPATVRLKRTRTWGKGGKKGKKKTARKATKAKKAKAKKA